MFILIMQPLIKLLYLWSCFSIAFPFFPLPFLTIQLISSKTYRRFWQLKIDAVYLKFAKKVQNVKYPLHYITTL